MSSVPSKYQPRNNTGYVEGQGVPVAVAPTDGRVPMDGGGEGPLSPSEVRRFKKLCQRIRSNEHLAAILQTVADPHARMRTYDDVRPWLRGFEVLPYDQLRFV